MITSQKIGELRFIDLFSQSIFPYRAVIWDGMFDCLSYFNGKIITNID